MDIKPKVAAAGVAGAVAVVITFVAARAGLDFPDDLVVALTTLITFGAGYFKKDNSNGDA